MKNIYVDEENNTLVCTKKFYKKAQYFGTKEYYELREALNATFIPGETKWKVVPRTITKNPEKNTYKNLTYKNMESYIETLESTEMIEAAKAAYKIARTRSKIQKSPYKWMVGWFTTNFEDYTKSDIFRTETTTGEKKNINVGKFAPMNSNTSITSLPN